MIATPAEPKQGILPALVERHDARNSGREGRARVGGREWARHEATLQRQAGFATDRQPTASCEVRLAPQAVQDTRAAARRMVDERGINGPTRREADFFSSGPVATVW
jgi:hypothetical protein